MRYHPSKPQPYDDIRYHEEHGEVIVDKAVWEDVKKVIMIKIVNTTEEYEGHDKYILLELENTGKTIILNYGGYTNIEYNREDNEITLDLDVFRNLLDIIIEEVGNGENIITY